MSQKLEDRLSLYERDHPIRNDQELIAVIQSILDEQDSVPYEKKDYDLISEATATILRLQGYSEEELDQMTDEALAPLEACTAMKKEPPTAKVYPRRRVLKWLIPVAVTDPRRIYPCFR